MGRYNFPPPEVQRRAALASELKKKSMAKRAAAAPAGGDKKKAGPAVAVQAAAAPKIDFVALRQASMDRRNFIAGAAAFAGAIGLTAAGIQRFMFPRLLFEPPSVFNAGKLEQFLEGVPMFFKDNNTWIVRSAGRVVAISGRCTHLGCTPSWLTADAKFKCPCHGSGFRMNGVNFEGPAPRALERFKVWTVGDTLMVDKAKMFFFEKAEWENPESFVVA